MTKEELYRTFLEDSLLIEKKYISPERLSNLRMTDNTNIKLLEVIKIAIHSNIDGESEAVISRKLNQFLNR